MHLLEINVPLINSFKIPFEDIQSESGNKKQSRSFAESTTPEKAF